MKNKGLNLFFVILSLCIEPTSTPDNTEFFEFRRFYSVLFR